jgi:hypothetical protein
MSQQIDPDLSAVQKTFDSLIEGGDGNPPGDGAGLAVESLHEIVLGLKARTERLLRGKSAPPSPTELEQLLTESCGQGYILEAQRLRTKRRMVAAVADASGATTQHEERELCTRYRSIIDELERLGAVIAGVRAQLEKARPV